MTTGLRISLFVVVAAALIIATGIYVVAAASRASERAEAPPQVAVTQVAAMEQSPRVVFRNTELGSRYGRVSMVSLSDPGGPRAFTGVTCDRVYATSGDAVCLRTKRGIVTTFEAMQLDAGWKTVRSWSLPGQPSRTRLSPDGTLLATTSFVTGHSYMQMGFSTATRVRDADGGDRGDLEKFTLVIGGKTVNPVDRNVWGVTFGSDDNTIYATVAAGGNTYLVRGDLAAQTLTAIHQGVECPSLSPDGSQIAYKKDVGGATPDWRIAVLDLATGHESVLRGEQHSVDDQVEWLDADTLLYGLPRANHAGVSDIWEIDTNPGSEPSLFIEQAWSPSVVRS
ncbi:hypothetical protein C6I20_12095 [Aeromicrobium sp. A1-2]|uniref:TolB family protein n=1 Tax=Aeromicrobium sp. A1-2 TaxID=2107713 RepID=UPI000E4BC00D|nr:PD40 domain-containing protein [Aeromicrobium sp. A1-2]AXT85852.1 hypothetical protein C6I20_12095 [Aeromicrobium sp. A1-2]